MPRNLLWRLPPIALALCCAVLIAGCATWQGPRIDPTGERLLIWPNEPTVVAPATFGPAPVFAPPPGATVVGPPPVAPIMQPLPQVVPSSPFGNVMAPPVYSDPPGMVATTPFVGPASPVPVVPTAPPSVVPLSGQPAAALALPPPPPIGTPIVAPPTPIPPPGREFLRVMPSGLIAPVGSEMLLKASICSGQGYLLANQRVDWSVARNGVGQFTELGFRDSGQLLSWWEAPHKLDDWSATSNTAIVPITLNSSTPDPNDDVPILRGESWVTVTSAVEGTSIITALAPNFCEFNQASSTIYWIDAQWVFPQSAIVEPGRAHTLTTTLMRRTDGAPLAGWIVRYDVGGGAALGYEGGSATEATTDAAGRASVEVNPKDAGGGATNVCITIIRPQTVGPAAMPRLELGRGAATITWNAGAAPLPVAPGVPVTPGAPLSLPAPPTNFGPPPSLPSTATQPAPAPASSTPAPTPASNPSSPPAAAAAGKPKLEVNLRVAGSDQVAVGGNASFDLTVTNRGDGVARNILITNRFDRGLRHEGDQVNEHAIRSTGVRDLPPNDSLSVRLNFQVVDGGKQCNETTVTADGTDPVSQTACVTARQAVLEVSIDLPRRGVVGESAKFNAVVKNTGEIAATNIELVIRCDAAINLTFAERGAQPLADGILVRIDRLDPAERRTIGMEGQYRSPSNKACARALVTADGGVNLAAEDCVEILTALTNAAPNTGGGTAPQATSDLRLSVPVNKNPARVGEKQLITVTIENAGQQTEHQVAMRVLLPPEMTLDATQIQPPNEATLIGQEIRFTTIAEFAPGQIRQYVIPVTPNRIGQAQVHAQVAATGLDTKTVDTEMIEIVSASP